MNLRLSCLCVLFLFPLVSVAEETALLNQLESALQTHNEAAYLSLFLPDSEIQSREKDFIANFLTFHYTTATFKLVEKQKDILLLHVLLQSDDESRFESWAIETSEVQGRTFIKNRKEVSSVSGLYKLQLSKEYVQVHDLEFRHLDAKFHLKQGSLFPITAGDEIAGAVFLGDASFEFAPQDPVEQHQINLFCRQNHLQAKADQIYFRSSARVLKKFFEEFLTGQKATDQTLYSKAFEIAKEADLNAYGVRIPLSNELWFPQLQESDLYCEISTSLGDFVYQFSPGEPENVLLAQKDKNRIISLYGSVPQEAGSVKEDFEVLSYKIRVNYNPHTNHLSAVTDIRLKSRQETSTILFKLNPALKVSQVRSNRGTLIHYQEEKTHTLHVVLNEYLEEGKEVSLQFSYQGKVAPDQGRTEAAGTQVQEREFYMPPTYLFSNHALWYPQLTSNPYSRLEISVTVPSGYVVITNGRLITIQKGKNQTVYSYRSELPLKYFSLFIGRLNGHFSYESIVPIDVYYISLDKRAAEDYARAADKILRFYSNYFGRYPYHNLTLVLRPLQEPGGHSPATFAIVNRVFSYFQMKIGRDPLYIPEFPYFFLAHEIAHQWWGQAVGWRSYRDQWLSEGFAQFAAAEYIRAEYGDEGWMKLARIFQPWVDEKTHAGPLILGSRLGHLTDDPQAFPALLYNKGAYVLNMLKNRIGSENFHRCLSEFCRLYQFKRTGIAEFRQLAQRYANEDLERFFNQWLCQWDTPVVTWTQTRQETNSRPTVQLLLRQPKENFYQLNIPVEAISKEGEAFQTVVVVDEPEERIEIPLLPERLRIDPLRENLAKYKKE